MSHYHGKMGHSNICSNSKAPAVLKAETFVDSRRRHLEFAQPVEITRNPDCSDFRQWSPRRNRRASAAAQPTDLRPQSQKGTFLSH